MVDGPQARTLRWGIYHRDREFARKTGDPMLAEFTTPDKEAAEELASLAGISGPTGIWAHLIPEPFASSSPG